MSRALGTSRQGAVKYHGLLQVDLSHQGIPTHLTLFPVQHLADSLASDAGIWGFRGPGRGRSPRILQAVDTFDFEEEAWHSFFVSSHREPMPEVQTISL